MLSIKRLILAVFTVFFISWSGTAVAAVNEEIGSGCPANSSIYMKPAGNGAYLTTCKCNDGYTVDGTVGGSTSVGLGALNGCKFAAEFTIETTQMSANTEFSFALNAPGEYMINWGDGTVESYLLVGSETISHTYTAAGKYEIGMSGQQTGYTPGEYDPVIRFSPTASGRYIEKLGGSLGAIFHMPELGMFYQSFMNNGNLTTISDTLFDGIDFDSAGDNANSIFTGTFYNCRSLKAIPSGLFKGVSRIIGNMFSGTFYGCTSLQSIPVDLFANISGEPGSDAFWYLFNGATNITKFVDANGNTVSTYVPEQFFGGLTQPASYNANMFSGAFANTGLLESCPTNTVRVTPYYADAISPKVVCRLVCPIGQYDNGAACVSCPAGYTTSSTGSTDISHCVKSCSVRSISSGQIKPDSTSVVYPGDCTYSVDKITCNAGYYSDGVSTTSCFACPVDSYCTGGSAESGTLKGAQACPANSSTNQKTGQKSCECDAGFTVTGVLGGNVVTTGNTCKLVPEFTVTTTRVAVGDTFSFTINAAGTYTIDWDDGTEATTYTATIPGKIEHKFASAGVHTIRIVGNATSYTSNTPAITFQGNTYIAELGGSLGAIFGGVAQPYMFQNTFRSCSNLKKVSDTLFAGITGAADYMFYNTFTSCTSLEYIPETLFSDVDGAARYMFSNTFLGCTSLKDIPANLFSGVSGAANYMFDATFRSCIGLTSVPSTLFSGVTGVAPYMFRNTFASCSGIKSIPVDLLANAKGTPGAYAFNGLFNAATGITKFVDATGNTVSTYIPKKFFGGLEQPANYNVNMFRNAFSNTGLATTCPSGYRVANLYYSGAIAPKVVCELKPEFTITTTRMGAGTEFAFDISAAGTYTIDWDDGNIETIEKTDTTVTTYRHTYATAGVRTIGIAGDATTYNATKAAISFKNNTYVAELGGSLGAIFGDTAQPYMFQGAFYRCTSLQSIPGTLFDGVTGAAASMFVDTFSGCTSLTEIPSGLFSGVSGAADYMFQGAFSGCTSLQSIPSDLFSGVDGAADYMFYAAFGSCTSLQSIPVDLFANVTGEPGTNAFASLFYGATNITKFVDADGNEISTYVPEQFFGGMSGTNANAFTSAFKNTGLATECPSGTVSVNVYYADAIAPKVVCEPFTPEFTITTIEDMADKTFSFTISAAGNYTIDWGDGDVLKIEKTDTTIATYTHTYAAAKTGGYTIGIAGDATAYNENTAAISFKNNTYVAELGGSLGAIFGGTAQPYMFYQTFYGCTSMQSIPENLFDGVTGAAFSMFSYTFYGCTSLQSIPSGLFSGVTGAAGSMFSSTFRGCTSLTEIPGTLFDGVTGAAENMFNYTFQGCTSLQSIPSGLFSGVSGAADYMFQGTFNGCTSLQSIPDTLFSGVTGAAYGIFNGTFYNCTSLQSIPSGLFSGVTGAANWMFHSTFSGCTSLQSIPSGLFRGVTGVAQQMFGDTRGGTFSGCTSLTAIPVDLFANITGTPVNYAFSGIFKGASNITKFVDADGNEVSTYVPEQFFGNLTAPAEYNSNMFADVFLGTGLAEDCPDGYVNANPYYADAIAPKVVCEPEPEFTITTIDMAANTTFSFSISAAGSYTIDWGDGSSQKIEKTDTTVTTYKHTYANGGVYTIGMAGDATAYNAANAAISFYGNTNIAELGGSLGAIFGGTAQPNMFSNTFNGCTSLTEIPSTLFSGISGAANNMFRNTFINCSALSEIPDGLFSGVTGAANYMFEDAFSGCTSLTEIPGTLFSGVSGAANYMFSNTFNGCTSLTEIPSTLFSGVMGAADSMFDYTFRGCTSLQSIPSGLFSGVTGAADYMFQGAFYGCTSLQSIPSGLFSGVSGAANYMFSNTFKDCTSLQSIPSGLFSGISGAAESMFNYTFMGCTSLQSIPSGLFSGVSGAAGYMFHSTFSGCTSLQSIPSGLFSGVTGAANCMFGCTRDTSGTFAGCTSLTSIPVDLFANITGEPGSAAFANLFNGATNITKFVDADGNTVSTYVPEQFFGGMSGTNANAFTAAFKNTGLADVCPDAYVNANPYYADAIAPKVVCEPDSEFTIKTIDMEPNTTFSFSISAAGNYTIDWGDGDVQKIEKTDTTVTTYTHTYANGGVYTISMAGDATDYNATKAAISFRDNTYVAELDGSLGAIFGGTAQPRMFNSTFRGCTSLQSIPSDLFSGVSGAANWMFSETFYGCSALSEIPSGLFDGVTGAAEGMFDNTFLGCTSLEEIPDGLFSGISGAADYMFSNTFRACTSLTEIPSTLFSGVTGAAFSMFSYTFYGCTSLQSIPSGLFSGVDGAANWMFNSTFSECTSLQSIPSDLFSGVDGAAIWMFNNTFQGCTSLQSIPVDLFANISGEPGTGAFAGLFYGATDITKFVDVDGNTVSTYVPTQFFGGMSGTNAAAFTSAFAVTQLAQTCPAGTINANPYYVDAIAPKVVCEPFTPEFTVKTIDMPAGTKFTFDITAAGNYTIDWGDGSSQKIEKTDTTITTYTHTYEKGGVYTISMAGDATTYNATNAAISFKSNTYVAELGGSLGAIFGGTAQPNMFNSTFSGCTSLQSIPGTLFDGVTGAAESMFFGTFIGCRSLQSIPGTLFDGVTGTAQPNMFAATFHSCTSLQSIPSTLFSGVSGAAESMFDSTFHSCTSLTEIPDGLFSGVTGAAENMFRQTFLGCSALSEIPSGLFDGVNGAATGMFTMTFARTGIEKIPSGLFKNVSGAADYMFSNRIGGGTFMECTKLKEVPADLFGKGITEAANMMFSGLFAGCTDLTSIPVDLFTNITEEPGSNAFQYLFYGATNITKFVDADGNEISTYVPTQFFGRMAGTNADAFTSAFEETQLAQTCPAGTINANPYYADAIAPKVVCEQFTPEFTITTIEDMADKTFSFTISAAGSYTIDWGDGSSQKIEKTDTNVTTYKHTYAAAKTGGYTIGIAGDATAYNADSPAISFLRNTYVAELDGSLGAIFDGPAQPYMFDATFYGCTSLQSIPGTLFDGVTGAAESMFNFTFYGCTSLQSIPGTLFSDVSGAAADMFVQTFYGCSALSEIPSGLFDGVNGAAESMFHATFHSCTSLQSIPSDLFSGVDGAARDMFRQTFLGCSALSEIPSGLFSGVTGAAENMFYSTFYGCTSLQSIPGTLFDGVTGAADYMFLGTFSGCTSLQSIPVDLFANITGTPADRAFADTFANSVKITNFVDADGNEISTYVPEQFFGRMSGTNENAFTMGLGGTFEGTGLADVCPAGTINANPYYATVIAPKVVCEPFTPEFTIKTIEDMANKTFSFTISAAGNYTIDWGDGSSQKIEKTDTNATTYKHTYAAAKTGGYTIGIAGDATDYNATDSAISFMANTSVAELDGSLGAIFGGTARPYMFGATFSGCTSLQSIPGTLFDGVTGAADYMFSNTFSDCSALSEIPSGLFDGVSGAAESMFNYTFMGCTSLQSIPSGLFSGVLGAANNMFSGTFSGCTSLQSIPSGLFSGVTGAAENMFSSAFYGCSALSEIPSGLFDGVNGAATGMFNGTFNRCTNLTEIPDGLFSGVSGAAEGMFGATFYGCSALSEIPSGLFDGVNGAAAGMFTMTFAGTGIEKIPSGLFKNVSGAADYMFSNRLGIGGTFMGCTKLKEVPADLFGKGITEAANMMFSALFAGCTDLTSIPVDLFANVKGEPGTGAFANLFNSATNITKFVDTDGNEISTYVPTQFFGGMAGTNADAFTSAFEATQLAQTCPAGTINANPYYADAIAPKVVCIPDPEFTITTTNMTVGNTFEFILGAAGSYIIDWGDGIIETIDKMDTNDVFVTHEYAVEKEYDIRMSGDTTSYPDYYSGISFANNKYIEKVSGSLGAMFGGPAQPYMFDGVFKNCVNLTEISADLFDGVTEAALGMFYDAFLNCKSLKTLPDGLFANLSGAAESMFDGTFYGCAGLTSIPETLFTKADGSGVSGAANSMFNSTFYGCSGIKTLPKGLFRGVSGGAVNMFYNTFGSCVALETIPGNLFGNVSSAESAMFNSTFSDCVSLVNIPVDLFANITSEPEDYAFRGMFSGATNITKFVDADNNEVSTYVPEQFFGRMAGENSKAFTGAFFGTGLAEVCPAGTMKLTPYYADAIALKVVCKPVCAAGEYGDGYTCDVCPDGYSSDENTTVIEECFAKCDAGYAVLNANAECSAVGAGNWITENIVYYGGVSVINSCASGLTTIGYGAGADEVADCGRILHVGENKLYLRSAKKNQDELALNVRLNMTNDNGESEERVFFGTMTTEEKFMSAGVDKALKINIGNTVYYVHDDSVM